MAWLIIIAALLLGLVSLLMVIGAQEPTLRVKGPVWFVAMRAPQGAPALAHSVWAARANFALIGAVDAYWTHFAIVQGAAPQVGGVGDAYIARLRLFAPPRLMLGLVRALIALGLLSRPPVEGVTQDAQALGYRTDAMPSAAAIERLLSQPPSYAPAMVNFLAYRGEGGRTSYRKYGLVAMRTVFRTGGALLFYGAVAEVARAASAGPCVGAWGDIAAMRYPNPRAILSMEHVPEYRAALKYRDEGLERTVVIASSPG